MGISGKNVYQDAVHYVISAKPILCQPLKYTKYGRPWSKILFTYVLLIKTAPPEIRSVQGAIKVIFTDGACPGCYKSHIHWWRMSRMWWKSYSLMVHVQDVIKVIFTDGCMSRVLCKSYSLMVHVQGVMQVIFTDSACPGCYESHIHWWWMSRILWKSYSLMVHVQGVMKVIFTDGACPECYKSHIHWWLHVQGVMKLIFTDSECPGCYESHIHWWWMSRVL